ncbi:hypothetical protein [Streptomyces sp. NBC_01233]|uniref:hypothetical protein n=1 Tax=Streptomyces sp. NBC_01233 TaxID=2903787 RepID=UPI002E13CE90|nr:hypothetical protein OG332_24295 [Streptomyces sp. NBC_01233]
MSSTPPVLPRLFHGGASGLNPGDLLVPHPPKVLDGCPICVARAAGESYEVPGVGVIDPPTGRPERIYVTSDREYARFYASRYWLGDLYTVEPVGELEPSTEDFFPTWSVPEARVVGVVSRAVRLTDKQRRTLDRRWGALEDERRRQQLRITPGSGR